MLLGPQHLTEEIQGGKTCFGLRGPPCLMEGGMLCRAAQVMAVAGTCGKVSHITVDKKVEELSSN